MNISVWILLKCFYLILWNQIFYINKTLITRIQQCMALYLTGNQEPSNRCPYRHEALVFIQSLLVGSNEESSILDPASVETRFLFQVFADHVPGVGQELHLHITGTELPQKAWKNTPMWVVWLNAHWFEHVQLSSRQNHNLGLFWH